MSTEAIAAVDAEQGRVSSAELRLASAHALEVPVGRADSTRVQAGHAAVASAEAALAQAQAALNAARALQAHTTPEAPQTDALPPVSNHLVDKVA